MSLTKLGFNQSEKDKKRVSAKSFAPAAALGALGFAASTADKQLGDISNKLDRWDNSLNIARQATKDRGITFNEADDIVERYTRGGQELATSKFMGSRAGTYLQNYYEGKQIQDRVARKFITMPDNKFVERQHTIDHYKLFKDPTSTPAQLKAHMIEKGLGDKSMQGANRSLSDNTRKILKDTVTYPTFESQHEAIKATHPKDAETFRTAILGKDWDQIGEARRLAGNTRDVVSTPELYKMHLQPKINAMRTGLPAIAKGSFVAAGVLGSGLIASQFFKKKASLNKDDKQRAIGTASVVSGVPLASVGFKKMIAPPKDIAITYGTMNAIGMGHSGPGRAIKKMVKEDPRFKEINVDTLERDTHSVFRGSPKEYALGINTGLGGINTGWADDVATKRTHGMPAPKIRAQRVLSYQTDLLDNSGHGSGSTLYNKKIKVLAYGENVGQKLKNRGFKSHVVSERFTPAVDPDAVKEIASFDDKSVLDKIHTHESNVMQSNPNEHSKHTLSQIEKHKGKKFITISGASRGDYVGIRAKELAEALDAHGLSKDYTVVAQMARGRDGIQNKLVQHDNIIPTGLLPRNLHNELQGKSVINWSNTGTSTVAENMLLKNVQAYPRKWGWHPGSPKNGPVSGSIAHRQDVALGEQGDHALLDEWNKGQLDFVQKQKGTITADTADDIVNLLKDKPKLNDLSVKATLRSAESYKEHTQAASKLVDVVHSEYTSARRMSRIKGSVPALAGAAIATYGLKTLGDSYKKKELKGVDIKANI
jgi:hypothetical protein